jgi:hypothetical protein
MRFIYVGILVLCVFTGGVVAKAETPSPTVQQAQQQVWDFQDQLADAHYHLALLRLNEETNRLQVALQKTRTPQKASEIQLKLSETDRKRLMEQRRLQLNHQLVNAERSGDRGTADSIRFQLKDLH